jgi:hypothetical protein
VDIAEKEGPGHPAPVAYATEKAVQSNSYNEATRPVARPPSL